MYSKSLAINVIWRLVGEIPETNISLPVYSSKLLVAKKIIILKSRL